MMTEGSQSQRLHAMRLQDLLEKTLPGEGESSADQGWHGGEGDARGWHKGGAGGNGPALHPDCAVG